MIGTSKIFERNFRKPLDNRGVFCYNNSESRKYIYFGISPIDLDESRERITGDWSYEYTIFELVRLYKIFDWENDELVLVGW